MRVKKMLRNLVVLGLSAFVAAPAMAQKTNIEVWHTLSGEHRKVFEGIVSRFNSQQTNVAVELTRFSSQEALSKAGQEAITGKRAKPDLVQLRDNHSPNVIAEHKDVMPLHQLLARHPIADANWFLAKTTQFVRDERGRLLAFPFMAEIPVMFYNLEAYRNAGLDINKPATTWPDLQEHLLKLRNEARVRCPYASSRQVNVHIENLAPMNNRLYLNPNNGLKTTRNLSFNFDTLYMRHLSLMVSWRKSNLFTLSTEDDKADDAFVQGDCAVLTTGSGSLAKLAQSNVKFGAAPLPYYPQATKEAGAPFVGGDALWVIAGQSPARNKATAELLGFLSTPVVAAEWHQKTGFLPLTDAAFRAADVSFYNRIPGVKGLVDQMLKAKGESIAGFRAPNYPQVTGILNQALNQALEDKEPPMSALTSAKTQAEKIIR
jgi:multiple sugar transport system substrate-binding protein